MIKPISSIIGEMPKILVFATAWFPPAISGEANILRNLSGYYSPEKLVFIAESRPGSREFDSTYPCKVYRLKYYFKSEKLFWRVIRLLEISWLIRKEAPNVILVGNGSIAFILRNALRILHKNIPYVILIHGTELLGLRSNTEPIKPYLKSSMIIANSDYTKSLAIQLGIPSFHVKVIRPGCDPNVFKPGLDVSGLRRKLGLDRRKIILTVGGLVERKGQDMVLRALKQVKAHIPNVHYLIAGTGVYLEELKKISTELGLGSYVAFLGYVADEDLPCLYNLCDIFIMPSREALGTVEGLGMVFIEAAACGKPCIAAKSGGMAEAVIDGKTGTLADPYDVDDIVKCILDILADEKKAKLFGLQGREMVEKEFAWSIYYKTLLSILIEKSF